tara:strand:- start:1247 stop:1417 length:171 start_codon:yes stop_codon:yes gene_type:complete
METHVLIPSIQQRPGVARLEIADAGLAEIIEGWAAGSKDYRERQGPKKALSGEIFN